MKQNSKNYVAFDCGNSSVRVILGQFDGETVTTELIHQVEHKEVWINGYFYWDILHIFTELKKGLAMAARKCGHIDSAGICTWGIDFGMMGQQGQLLANPLCYRNGLGNDILQTLDERERRFMFDATGIHNHQMNSLYQFLAYKKTFPEQVACAKTILLTPDLLNFLFTGTMSAERTITSTTQYYSVIDHQYSEKVAEKFALDMSLFPPLINNGETIGELRPEIAQDLNVNIFPFICVPSHDTASAVTAVPASEKNFIFISSGTWSLIGTELNAPIVSDGVYDAGLANEEGAFQSTTLLKNSAGMFIIQRIRAELDAKAKKLSWDEIVAMAKSSSDDSLLFDPNNERLFNPPSMIGEIRKLLAETGQNGDCSVADIIRSVYRSIAMSYRYTIESIAAVTGKEYGQVYIIGGGSKNMFLNQLVADVTGMVVTAGPVEATSLGNIMVQLTHFDDRFSTLADLRGVVRRSIDTQVFAPQKNEDQNYQRYLAYLN